MAHGMFDYLRDSRGDSKSDWFLLNMLQSSRIITDKDNNALLAPPETRKISKSYK